MNLRYLLLLLAACFTSLSARAFDSVVVINEIQYHPANEITQTEWIELRSLQGVDVNISRWALTGDVEYVIPEGTILSGGGYLVIAAVPGQIAGALGPWSGQLSNGSGTIRLVNRNGRIMDSVSFEDGGDWPTGPDGGGVTLSRRAPTAVEGPAAWSASAEIGGSAGRVNFLEAGAGTLRTRVVAANATWRYLDNGTTPPANWNTIGFNDSAWGAGPGLLYGGGASPAGVQSNVGGAGQNLLGWWKFEETAGTSAANEVAGGVVGTLLNGVVLASDATRGRVVQFDGVDDRVAIGDAYLPTQTLANDFTWSCWVKSASTTKTGSVILGNRSKFAGGDFSPLEFMKMQPSGFNLFRNGTGEAFNYTAGLTDTGVWHHMAIVKQGATITAYLDGAANGTKTITANFIAAMPFFIGGDPRGSAECFQGSVDDVAVWTRALPSVTITGLANGTYTPATAPTILATPVAPPLPSPAFQTAITAGPEPRYFRTNFNFTGSPAVAKLELWPVADDGAVIYLNGTEIYRQNVPVTAEVGNATFPLSPIILPASALIKGTNVLSAEVHQSPGSNDIVFGADLVTNETPSLPADISPTLRFSEISGAADANFRIELKNAGSAALSLSGWQLRASTGQTASLPNQILAPGALVVLDVAALGFTPADGTKLYLVANDGVTMSDARAVTNRLRGLNSAGSWEHPATATFGAVNSFSVNKAIVINEIFYHGMGASAEQWIELYNKTAAAVDIGLWKFSDGVSYQFPSGTTIAPNGYLVIAWNPTAFTALHPGVTAFGPWSGSLSGKGELLRLRDASDNVVNELAYSDSGRWSEWADGGGSSLELKDPNADNSRGEAWDSSDESSHSTWQPVSYTGSGANIGIGVAADPIQWNEFVLGLLSGGECLVDDISVREDPAGVNRELIQNGDFSNGTASGWRIIGNHRPSSVVDDPLQAGNKVLKLVTNSTTEHMNNHAETTLKSGATLVTIDGSKQYKISFRAKWLRGSNRLHSRLYFNRMARQTLLNVPSTGGTPGAVNSRRVANLGPTFNALAHAPVIPAASQSAVVSVAVADSDGIGTVELFTSVGGAAFASTPMSTAGDGTYSATVAGQAAGALVQFYVRATDLLGAVSFFPAAGLASRAMIPWNDGKAQLVLASGARPHNLRVVLTGAAATEFYKRENVMSNEFIPCTVIWDEREVYYRAGVRLKSSEHGRFDEARVGYVIEFGNDELFLGAHGTVAVDRSGGTAAGQGEIMIKNVSNSAGGIYSTEDDIIRVIAAQATGANAAFTGINMTGAALLSKSRFDGEYLDGQWDNGSDGPLFKYDLVYVQTQTIDPVTRVIGTLPENPKIPQSGGEHPGVSVVNLGADKELYRWHWLIKNAHSTDDYSGVINMATAVGQASGSAAFATQTQQYIDVNAWLRASIPALLFGVIDNYIGAGSTHNCLFFFPPGKKAVLIPWDLDYLSQTNAQASLTTGGDLNKFLLVPANKRIFYSHLLDILTRSFNTPFLTRWAQHYSRFGTEDMSAQLSYLTARAQFAQNVLNGTGGQTAPIAPVAFSLTTPGPLTVGTPQATVSGRGWIDVDQIRLLGSSVPLAVTWTGDSTWTLQLPVEAGTRNYTLVAFNPSGVQVGTVTLSVTGTGTIAPAGAGKLLVSEINFNPAGSTDATEFIELLNVSGTALDLGGCHFDEELNQGISYTFPAGVQMAVGARLLVVRDAAAFSTLYGQGLPLAPGVFTGALDNSGESLVLYSATGQVIFRFSYKDNVTGTDGDGKSLVRVLSSKNPDPNDYTWRASSLAGGNPGTGDGVAFAGTALADGDGDGSPALLEYAFGTSDSDPLSRPAPVQIAFNSDGTVSATYLVLPNADDVIVAIETTSSLTLPWQPYTGPVSANGPMFFRCKVTLR